MTLLALGINHQTAPVSLRERVAFADDRLPSALAALRALPSIREAALLSTCNRTEIYAVADDEGHALGDWLARHHDDASELHAYLYWHYDANAVRHLFRVATGLESMVLGEPQILGQVKDAYAFARDAHTLKTPLERLFQNTFAVAKRVRSDTRIGANPVSVAFTAVRLAERVFADLAEACVLLIGAGETIELAARHLTEAKVRRLIVANRTLDNAQTLATRFGGYAIALCDLGKHLAEADVVIASTASREPVLLREQVAAAIAARRRKPMFLVDIAVPRDIEPSVADLEDVYLYTIDDLRQVIDENLRSRREAAREAEAMIELSVEHFMRAAPHQRAGHHARTSVAERLLARIGEAQRDLVECRHRPAIHHAVRTDAEIQQDGLLQPLVHDPTADAIRFGDARRARFERIEHALDRRAQRGCDLAFGQGGPTLPGIVDQGLELMHGSSGDWMAGVRVRSGL